MNKKILTLINTSVLTSYGNYSYESFTLEQVKKILRDYQVNGEAVQSAIGHQSTAELLTTLLEFPVAVDRMEYKQMVGDVAVVFKLKSRAPEGKVLSLEEIEEIGYEFGLLLRTA
jgi:hypothetical protein